MRFRSEAGEPQPHQLVGGRQGNATYQYTLSGDDADTLPGYADRMVAILKRSNVLTDLDADTQQTLL